jgi:hypothetical protein
VIRFSFLFFSFFQFCDVATLVIIHKTAKFGYSSERKVEKFKKPTIFWRPTGTYCQRMAISEFFPLKSGNLWHFFKHKNPLYELHWIFFCHQVANNCPKKKKKN